jgi:hypothetical protein
MKIIVTSNCQTAGIAVSLREIFYSHQIIAAPMTLNDEEIIKNFSPGDLWISTDKFYLAEKSQVSLITIPKIQFAAFHPDICYAKNSVTDKLTEFHYNSNIIAWSYNKGIPVQKVEDLFVQDVFNSLGYFNSWELSCNILKELFSKTDLGVSGFNIFYKNIKRKNCFMHSINHPKIEALKLLAEIIAVTIDKKFNLFKTTIDVPDSLTDTVWPIYPEIGYELGLNGNYNFKFDQLKIRGLSNYIQIMFESYKSQGIDPGNLSIIQPACADFDQILNSYI